MEFEMNEKELYQQPLSFKHEALVDLTLSKSPKDTTEKDPIEKDHQKDFKDDMDKDREKELTDSGKELKDDIDKSLDDKDPKEFTKDQEIF